MGFPHFFKGILGRRSIWCQPSAFFRKGPGWWPWSCCGPCTEISRPTIRRRSQRGRCANLLSSGSDACSATIWARKLWWCQTAWTGAKLREHSKTWAMFAFYCIVLYNSVQHRHLCVFNFQTFCCLHHSSHVFLRWLASECLVNHAEVPTEEEAKEETGGGAEKRCWILSLGNPQDWCFMLGLETSPF